MQGHVFYSSILSSLYSRIGRSYNLAETLFADPGAAWVVYVLVVARAVRVLELDLGKRRFCQYGNSGRRVATGCGHPVYPRANVLENTSSEYRERHF